MQSWSEDRFEPGNVMAKASRGVWAREGRGAESL